VEIHGEPGIPHWCIQRNPDRKAFAQDRVGWRLYTNPCRDRSRAQHSEPRESGKQNDSQREGGEPQPIQRTRLPCLVLDGDSEVDRNEPAPLPPGSAATIGPSFATRMGKRSRVPEGMRRCNRAGRIHSARSSGLETCQESASQPARTGTALREHPAAGSPAVIFRGSFLCRGSVEREIDWQQYGQTGIHPLALAFSLAMGAWLLWARRDRAVLPVMLVLCLIPVAQRVVVASLGFNMLRILILLGWSRILYRGEARNIRWCRLDTVFVAYLASGTLAYVIREGNFGALIYRLGVIFDACGIYFMLRALLRSSTDVLRAALQMALIASLLGASMLVEYLTGRNFFAVFGGVDKFTVIFDGRFRCQGSFSHPIMMGSFGAGLAPILGMIAIGRQQQRALAGMGVAACFLIVATSASSGPILALLAAIAGCALFVIRNEMRLFRYGVAAVLIFLHLVREKPVWQLIGRVSDLMGGTGYHRVKLIDGFLYNWHDWFWVGTSSTAGWGWGLSDVTNQFVYEGVQGGIFNLLSLIALLTVAFQCVGSTVQRAERARHISAKRRLGLQVLAWGLGVSLATHCISWISVTYFGQMTLIFQALLAFIATVYQTPELARGAVRKPNGTRPSDAAGTRSGPGQEALEGRSRPPRFADLLRRPKT